ncbi:MAG: type pilus assembly protein PilB, partial [Patescibacteria group bacterium]|nr:type pilus assembly protein PilB [Patescibacteria group bacterium]
INERQGFTYPVAIRSILRQDPDVILVGEIRDKETANIATEAALTGHLVLSTLHTEDSLGSIVRLIQLGVAEWLISSTVVTVLNQRLIRRFCDCAEYVDEFPGRDYFYGREIDDGVVDFLEEHWDRYMVKRAVGCKKCDGEGYKGMQVVVEQLSLTSTVRDMIREGRTYREVIDYIRERHSMNMIFEEGFRQVLLGVTAFEELRDLPRGDYVMKSPDQIIRDATETVEVRQVDLDPPERKRTTIIIDPSSPLPQGACSAEDTLPLPPFTGMNEKSLQPVAAANAEITEVTGLPGFVGMKNGPPPTGDGITEIMGLEAFTGVSSGSIRLSRTVEHPESHAPVPQPHAVTQSQPLFLPAPEVPDVIRIVPREHTIIVKALVTARADQEIQRGLNELIRNKTETVLEAYYRYRGHPEIWTKIPGIKEAMETMKQDRRTRNKVAQRIEVSTEAVERLLKEVPIAEDTDFDK